LQYNEISPAIDFFGAFGRAVAAVAEGSEKESSTHPEETGMIADDKQTEVKQIAEKLYAQKPDWGAFYREILGVGGIVRQAFPSRQELVAFEQSPAYQEILRLLTMLRQLPPAIEDPQHPKEKEEEPTRVITVRLPQSLHAALRAEAHEHRTSMNKLCISKLLQWIDSQNVPTEVRE
jgi:hypothetical protein